MIYIPYGKSLVAVEVPVVLDEQKECEPCYLIGKCEGYFLCSHHDRKDHREVIFKLANRPKGSSLGSNQKLINGIPVEMIIHE